MVNPDFATVFWEVQCPVIQQVRTVFPIWRPLYAPVPTSSPTHHLSRQEVPKSSCYEDCFLGSRSVLRLAACDSNTQPI